MFSDGTGRLKTFFAVNILLSLFAAKTFIIGKSLTSRVNGRCPRFCVKPTRPLESM
jgi:hypothetical protein